MNDDMNRANAFSAVLGADYDLLKYSYPHHDEFQTAVADWVRKYFADSPVETIKAMEGGAGSGVTTSFLLDADERLRIYAVDSSRVMLDQAAALLGKNNRRFELIESDLLDYIRVQPDESFDVFVAVWTLHNLQPSYRIQLLKGIHRVLKAGGLFISGDKYAVEDPEQHQQQLESQLQRFQQFPTDNQSLIDAWVKHNLEDDKIPMGERDQIADLEDIGFEAVDTIYRQDMEAIVVGIKA